MTRQQLRELVKASNPVSAPERLLPQEQDVRTLYQQVMHRAGNPQQSADLLEQPVERRRDMQTQDKPIQIVREPRTPRSRRRLVPALAGAIAVIVIAVGVVALTGNTESDVAARSPLQVTDLFDEYIVSANYGAAADLYTQDATWQLVESPALRFSDELPDSAPVPDWDGDGRVTELDNFASLGVELYAGGTTNFLSCTQPDAFTAVCDEVREGWAFPSPSHSANWTFTIADGLIDSIVIDVVGQGTDSSALRNYGSWVQQNRPELAGDLVNEFTGAWKLNPDTIDMHRELVAEWQAQR